VEEAHMDVVREPEGESWDVRDPDGHGLGVGEKLKVGVKLLV